MAQSEDEMEIMKDESEHTHSEQGFEIYSKEESVKTPSPLSYELDYEKCSEEEEETNNRNWGFTHFDVELSA